MPKEKKEIKIKVIFTAVFFLLSASCSKGLKLDQELIVYKEKSIPQSKFIKSLLHQGFLLYGKNLALNLKEKNIFEKLKQKTLELELEGLFIQNIADKNKIIIKNDELKAWIDKRTRGLSNEELEYFLSYSNMSIKEWKALFKNQLLKDKVLKLYKLKDFGVKTKGTKSAKDTKGIKDTKGTKSAKDTKGHKETQKTQA